MEGGLHLPLGSSSSIMRKMHHQWSPYGNKTNHYRRCDANAPSPPEKSAEIRPPPFDAGTKSNGIVSPRPSSRPSIPSSAPTLRPKAPRPTLEPKKKQRHSPRQLQAIQRWETSRREKEMHSHDEVQQNVRAVLAQRKKAARGTKQSGGRCSGPPPAAAASGEEEEDATNRLDRASEMLELASHHKSWCQREGRLIVFESVPRMSPSGVVARPVSTSDEDGGAAIATLSPGSVVRAVETVVLDSRTLRPRLPAAGGGVDDGPREGRRPRRSSARGATIRLLKIDSPRDGYVVSRLHDYPYVAPGSPLDYVPDCGDHSSAPSDRWTWRVVYQPDGAFVRAGSELVSDRIGTLPYGSFCSVEEKIVNDMGLSRLKIRARVEDYSLGAEEDARADKSEEEEGEGRKEIEGWISLFINPLSGNGGRIVEPVNFPVPALYKVICEDGAVIRSGIEVSTSQIGLAPKGTILSIVGRAFSDHPRSRCIERFQLAGGRGWISPRLTGTVTGGRRIVELVGLDESFDPDDPAEFHLKEQKKARSEQTVNNNNPRIGFHRQISEINDDDSSDQEQSNKDNNGGRLKHSTIVSTPMLYQNGIPTDHAHANRCLICLSDERTATIVHGETGHIACCLTCARVLNARGDSCPVCRLPIDTVIQHFWA